MSDTSCVYCGHAADLHDAVPPGCVYHDSEGPCPCTESCLQVDNQGTVCLRCGFHGCQCNPHSKAVQLTYAQSERPGEALRQGHNVYTAHVVVRHEADGDVWTFASPDDVCARHDAQRWAQDTGVRHSVLVATLVVTHAVPDLGANVPEVGTKEGA